jgi:hypothetical protein
MGTGKGRCALAALAGGLALAVPAHAGAEVTVGSDLAPNPGNADPCSPDAACTISNWVLSGQSLTSPLDGVVVRWRVRAQATMATPVDLRLRVIRERAGGESTGINSSVTRTIPTTGLATFSFATRQAIAVGDEIGLDIEPPSDELLIIATAFVGPTFDRWQPPLGNGETASPNPPTQDGEIMLNADVERDTDDDGFGDETQDDCPGSPGPRNGCETTPPETTMTKAPKRKIKTRKRKKRVRFEFVSSEPGSDFRCAVDDEPPVGCDSPFKHRFRRGKHRFEVQAIDQADNADPTPAFAKFKLKRKERRR